MVAATSVEAAAAASAVPAAPSPAVQDPGVRPATAIDLAITEYLQHMGVERGLALNTLSAYRRDLTRYSRYPAPRDRVRPSPYRRFRRRHSPGREVGSQDGGGRPRPA
jgi:integrase/recombinase XerD